MKKEWHAMHEQMQCINNQAMEWTNEWTNEWMNAYTDADRMAHHVNINIMTVLFDIASYPLPGDYYLYCELQGRRIDQIMILQKVAPSILYNRPLNNMTHHNPPPIRVLAPGTAAAGGPASIPGI
jgi:hypothetical protein